MADTVVPGLRFLDDRQRRGRACALAVDSGDALRASLSTDGAAIFVVPDAWIDMLRSLGDVVVSFDGDAHNHWDRVILRLAKERQAGSPAKAVLYQFKPQRMDGFRTTVDSIFEQATALDPDAIVILAVSHERLMDLADASGAKLGPVLRSEDMRALMGSATVPAAIVDAFPGKSRHAEFVRGFATNAMGSPTALLLGPGGTGKRVLARAIRDAGAAAVASDGARGAVGVVKEEIDCGTFIDARELTAAVFGRAEGGRTTPGAWDRAAGGTLLLIEFADASLPVQRQIATAIREGSFRRQGSPDAVRVAAADRPKVIATTRKTLDDLRDERMCDQTLFHALSLHIRVPSLVQRWEDFDQLANAIWCRIDPTAPALSGDVLRKLKRHLWPGQLRELKRFLTSVARWFGPSPEPAQVQRSLEDIQTSAGGGWGLAASLPPPSDCARMLDEMASLLADLNDRMAVLDPNPATGGVPAAEQRAKATVPEVEPTILRLGEMVRQPFLFADESTWRAVNAVERLVGPFADWNGAKIVAVWVDERGGSLFRLASRKVKETLSWIASLG